MNAASRRVILPIIMAALCDDPRRPVSLSLSFLSLSCELRPPASSSLPCFLCFCGNELYEGRVSLRGQHIHKVPAIQRHCTALGASHGKL